MKETCFKVLGKDITIPISVAMTEKTTVHCEWSDKVLRTLAPVRMWKLTNIPDLRVLHYESPHTHGGDLKEGSGSNHSENTWHPS